MYNNIIKTSDIGRGCGGLELVICITFIVDIAFNREKKR